MARFFEKGKLFFFVLILAFVFVVTQWLVGMFKNPNQMGIIESMVMDMEIQVPEGAMPVQIEMVKKQVFSSTVTYTGQAKAYNDIPIYSRAEGWLVSLPVYAGDSVKKGQLLARLDAAELTSNYQSAHYSQKRSQEAIDAAKSDLDYWISEIKRAEALVLDDVITQEEYEREQSQFESSRSKYQQMKAQSQAAYAYKQSQAIRLGYTNIFAPMAGVVTERTLDQGVLVKPGMEILRMAQLSPIRVQANVAESDFKGIKKGQRVLVWKTIKSSAQFVLPIETTVSVVFPNKNLSTRTAIVEVLLPNENLDFVPGDFVSLTIETGERANVITVPRSAIIKKDRETALWLALDGKAKLRYVTTGAESAERIEIVSGLSEGEQVVIKGHQNLLESHRVVSAEFGVDGIKALPKAASKIRFSKANHYELKQNLKHWVLTARLENSPAKVGENKISIKLTPLHGMLPSGLSIEAKSLMPAMPNMRVPSPSVRSEEIGVYSIHTDLMMSGLWQIDLTFKKDKKIMAQSRLEIEVPD